MESFSRCTQYRGSTVQFNSCLNLSNPQFIASTHPKSAPTPRPNVPFKPRAGPYPAIRPAPGQPAAAGFRPTQRHVSTSVKIALLTNGGRQPSTPVAIMANPNRGLQPRLSPYATVVGDSSAPTSNHTSGGYGNRGNRGRERGPINGHGTTVVPSQSLPEHGQRDASGAYNQDRDGVDVTYNPPVRGRGGFPYPPRGTRGRGFAPSFDRGGRGRGGFRGRGRGGSYATVPS